MVQCLASQLIRSSCPACLLSNNLTMFLLLSKCKDSLSSRVNHKDSLNSRVNLKDSLKVNLRDRQQDSNSKRHNLENSTHEFNIVTKPTYL